jgi:hypothetical protein
VGVFDGLEVGVMDKELEEAQNLTKEELLAKFANGRPGRLGA